MKEDIQKQLSVIDSLLRDKAFCLSLAKAQHIAYYTGIGQEAPPFLTPEEENAFVRTSVREEKIAIGLAGFYAVECAVGLLCDQANERPSDWLRKIGADKTDAATNLLLNRFANATWKAGQPFKGLDKITRPVFRSASFLRREDIQKDHEQVKAAAIKLLSALGTATNSGTDSQMKKIRELLQSQSYALEIAECTNDAYADDNKNDITPALKQNDTATVSKPAPDQKIATNLAGFYAVEACTDYLASSRDLLPARLLKSIADNSISEEDKNLYNRFANATWKAGQPFRGLERIQRETFTPFYFLTKADIDKDWVQVKAAAKKILQAL